MFGGKSHEFLVDVFRVFPGYSGETIDGVFVHTGQLSGLPDAIVLEKVIQNPYSLVQRKPTT